MFDEQRRIVAYLDGSETKVNALRELQCEWRGIVRAATVRAG